MVTTSAHSWFFFYFFFFVFVLNQLFLRDPCTLEEYETASAGHSWSVVKRNARVFLCIIRFPNVMR